MTWVGLAVFLLACHGLVSAVTGGAVFKRFRGFVKGRSLLLGELVHCPMCLGFWVGLGAALGGFWEGGRGVGQGVVAGLCSSAFCWGMRVVLARMGEDEL